MGKRRHAARQLALQVLYAHGYLPDEPEAIVERLADAGEVSRKNWTTFGRELTEQTVREIEALDAAIAPALEHWRIERLSALDHCILRLALCEMRHFGDIPIRVTLDEYIELAKQFGTDDSAAFVNGILNRLAQEFAQKDFRQAPQGS